MTRDPKLTPIEGVPQVILVKGFLHKLNNFSFLFISKPIKAFFFFIVFTSEVQFGIEQSVLESLNHSEHVCLYYNT